MGNSEIKQTILYYSKFNMRGNYYFQNIFENLRNQENKYENMISYVNSILRSRYYFYSICEFQKFLNSTISSMNVADPRRQNLQSVVMPLTKLEYEYKNDINALQNIVNSFNNSANYQKSPEYNDAHYKTRVENDIVYKIIYAIGILMVLIGVSLFGKYVLAEFLTNEIKGILLYLFGAIILSLGVFVVKKYNKPFSQGIVILGMCEIFVSTVINVLYLEIMNIYVAVIITLIVSIGIIIYSYKEKSSVIRCFALGSGILSLVCALNSYESSSFYEASKLLSHDFYKSLAIVSFVIIINCVNILLPLRQNKKSLNIFINYSVIINVCILLILAGIIMPESVQALSYFFILLSIYINKVINKNQVNYANDYSILFVALIFGLLNNNLILWGAAIIISVIGLIICKESIRSNFVITCCIYAVKGVTFLKFNDGTLQYAVIMITIAIIVVAMAKGAAIKNNIIFNICIYFGVVFLLGMQYFTILFNGVRNYFKRIDNFDLIIFLVQAVVILVLFIVADIIICRKNEATHTVIKYSSILLCIPISCFANNIIYNAIDVRCTGLFIFVLFCIAFLLAYSNIEGLSNKSYKIDNSIVGFSLIVLSFFMMFFMMFTTISISRILFFICTFIYVYIFTKNKYNSLSMSPLFRNLFLNMLAVFYLVFMCKDIADARWIYIVTDVFLMIIACINVYKGFKNRVKGIRIAGVVIAFFVCGKVLLYDNFGMNIIEKTLVFITIGILSIIFAYIYSLICKKIYMQEREEEVRMNDGYNNYQNNNGNYNNMNMQNRNNYINNQRNMNNSGARSNNINPENSNIQKNNQNSR